MVLRRLTLVKFASLLFCLSPFEASPQSSASTPASKAVIWRDPGNVETLDFIMGPGGSEKAPTPPFVFQEELQGGSRPKILVNDAKRNQWAVKWGSEAKAESFAIRMLWATGYIVEPSYFVPSGTIDSVGALKRAAAHIDRSNDNAFRDGRFELRDPNSVPVANKNWTWGDNPFASTQELAGLRVMTMLVSNWDTKDASSSDGPNTSILRVKLPDGPEELHYIINDWGATMGRWGAIGTRSKWDCEGYSSNTAKFAGEVDKNGMISFGYKGKHTRTIADGITVENVRWLMSYLGRISDDQIRAGLRASGATAQEVDCFTASVRARIEQLRRLMTTHPSQVSSAIQ